MPVNLGQYNSERTQNTHILRDTCVTQAEPSGDKFQVTVSPPTAADGYGYVVTSTSVDITMMSEK